MQSINLIFRRLTPLAGAGLLVGCSALIPDNAGQPSIDPTMVVQVNQSLEIPNGKARVYIQNNRVIIKPELDKFSPYCSVLMQQLHKRGEPLLSASVGQYEIIKLRRYNDDMSFPGTFFMSSIRAHDFPKMVIFEVEMRLKSLQQPGVRALICAKQVMVMGPLFTTDHYPTITEIRNTLGNIIEIVTPQ